jgi:hypothetical protein
MTAKKSYKFNFDILDFVEVQRTGIYYLGRGILFLFAAFIFLSVYYLLFSSLISTPKERNLIKIKENIASNYASIIQRYRELDKVIGDLQERDANIYRHIFETEPSEHKDDSNDMFFEEIENLSNNKIIYNTKHSIDTLQRKALYNTKMLKRIIELCKSNA